MMSAPRYVRLGWLVLCLGITVSAYGGSNRQQTAPGTEADGLGSNGNAINHNTSSITSPINANSPLSEGLPGSKFGGTSFSGGKDQKLMGPPLPPIENRIPEPAVLLDLGVGLAAFVTMWNFKVRRSG